MADFKVIETQEQLDAIIKDRLDRVENKFKGYLSPDEFKTKTQELNDQIAGLNTQLVDADSKYKDLEKTIGEKDAEIKKYETASVKSRVAHEIGLPFELIGRISGETEDEIRADAESLSKIFKSNNVPPLADPNPKPEGNEKNNEMKALLKNLRGEN